MNKALFIGIWGVLLTAFGMMLVFFYWTFYPYKTLEFKQDTFPVENKVIDPGGNLIYSVDYCKYTDLPATVSRSFADSLLFPMQSMTTNNRKGCGVNRVVIPIPESLELGDYFMIIRYQYQVNPIRQITLVKQTDGFTVTDNKGTHAN